MALDVDFNDSSTNYGRKINDFVLGVSYPLYPGSSATSYYQYDFVARIMTARTGASEGGAVITPFSALDGDSLEALRQRLIDLGGKPPALGPTLDKTALRKPGALNA
ncbi:MAG TPA: hypothetical protein VEF76_08455 [Patescibacteria group bacterium]|nr:hypothetical protein [Patescibacteria group bacterium]